MKRKVKSFLAFTTVSYRIVGLILLPCLLLLLCVGMLYRNGYSNGFYPQFFLYSYVVLYEIIIDYWMLGGCFSDGGKNLRYFRTSRTGPEIVRNAALMDLVRRFLYCMIFAVTAHTLAGQKMDIVTGLAMYCVIVGVLNGSRHIDSFQILLGIAFFSQLAMTAVSAFNYFLFQATGVNEARLLLCLIIFYGAAAVGISILTLRRITACVQKAEV